ncbi:MAG TPA: MYXO-CTERM sorting domain-containing protein, partial [Polyangiaceae bacterium]
SSGTAFAAPVLGPEWSDPKGWSAPEYYMTIRYGGARLHPLKTAPQGSPDGGTGGVVGGGGNGGGNAVSPDGSSADDSGCGCTTVGAKRDSSLGLFGVMLGLTLAAARRRKAKRTS